MQYVELEAGLIGLVVGAVASGSVQSYLSRSDRRREGRNAARVLYIQLHEAESAIEELRPRRDWDNMITEWAAFGTTWSQYRESVAHVLNTPRFVQVDSAFAATTTLSRARTRDLSKSAPPPGQPPSFDPSDLVLQNYAQIIQGAKRIVLKVSFRWWELRARRKALSG
jgi:hypothetical protein